jgi:SAM-dependent methyltransferase
MNVGTGNNGRIRAEPCLSCFLCGGDGYYIHLEQADRLFGASGSWNFKKCRDRKCGLIWLDPMPLKEDIGKAYANYYTHSALGRGIRDGWAKRAFKVMKRGYQMCKYGYGKSFESLGLRCAGRLLYLFPIRRREVEEEVRMLHAVPQGRLLDVGCGSGEWLESMRERGWRVVGVDFDQTAVNFARQAELEVRCGSLEEQHFAEGSFDAVTLNHVIEHVPDPLRTVAECARILKPAGKLVMFTPNGSSLGHWIFKRDWRGLEPPRHLQIFTIQSLVRILQRAGFKKVTVRPQIAKSVIYESFLLWRGSSDRLVTSRRNWPAWVFARLFTLLELCLCGAIPGVADCIGVVAVKE